MLQSNTFLVGVLVTVISFVSHKGFLSNVLRQAVQTFSHGRMEYLHYENKNKCGLEKFREQRDAKNGEMTKHKSYRLSGSECNKQ